MISEAIAGERDRRNVSVGEAERLAGALPDSDLEGHMVRLVNVLATFATSQWRASRS